MGEEQCLTFEEIKCQLVRPPVLHLPYSKEDFLYIYILANSLTAVLYIKFKMENLN